MRESENGRYFTDFYNRHILRIFVQEIHNLQNRKNTGSQEMSDRGRGEEKWLNLIMQKKMNIGYENEYSTDAMTGGPDKRRQLYYQLIQSMKKAESVDIIVSFLMESGVKMLLQELENTLKRGAKIRILTGNYLGITQPSALYLIKRKLGDRVDLRFYCEKGRSFHPKSYIFHYADHSELYIGSSNISRSALTSGIEWNYRFSSKKDPENYAEFFLYI